MKIAFFGTYFYNFQEIVNNAASIYESHFFYFFTDKKSYTHLFNNAICSAVDLSYKRNEYHFTDEELFNFFQCDYDRLSEFNITKPKGKKDTICGNLFIIIPITKYQISANFLPLENLNLFKLIVFLELKLIFEKRISKCS